ncbi:MAG: hypothetical protein AB8H86_18450 [Polyangiales bacterium]
MYFDLRAFIPLLLLVSLGCSQSAPDALREYCSSRDTMPEEWRQTMYGLISWRHERITNVDTLAELNRIHADADGHRAIENLQQLLDAHGVENCAEIVHLRQEQAREDALPPHDDSYIHEAFRRDR